MPTLPHPARRPVVLCILDGVGWGRRDATDAVFMAETPNLDRLLAECPHMLLKAHGTAVGLPSDADMGNSEVGHNAMGAGRVIEQGAKLIEAAIASGDVFRTQAWREVVSRSPPHTVHLLGLVSDGNVHSHVDHLLALIRAAVGAGVKRIRVHALTDGRDVSERSALTWIEPLEAELAALAWRGIDARIASGGGRMTITMDRYEADWQMVKRGWDCHVFGVGRRFGSAGEAIRTLYADDPSTNDQLLPAFVCDDNPPGRPLIRDGDAVVLFNFRGDRAMEISRAFTGPVPFDTHGPNGEDPPRVYFAGMMQYDGDWGVPEHYLVEPPVIDQTVGEQVVKAGLRTLAVSETQKFGHVTYFFNGNRTGAFDPTLEVYREVPSDNVPFDRKPEMKAAEVVDAAIVGLYEGFDHVRLNLANGDMVGHTGDFAATVRGLEAVDRALGRLVDTCVALNAILLVTADHGNADLMFELDKRGTPQVVDGRPTPKTSHTLNPVPFILMDPKRQWALRPEDTGAATPDLTQSGPPVVRGIAQIGATLLQLLDVPIPGVYLPSLVEPA